MLRLKISPREALIKIDKLVLEGVQILKEHMPHLENYRYIFDSPISEDEKEYYESQKNDAGGLSEVEELEYIDSLAADWAKRTSEELEELFVDYTPQFSFRSAGINFFLQEALVKKGKQRLLIAQHLKIKDSLLCLA